jgi:rfaE bifunctional protein kinase chain/domain
MRRETKRSGLSAARARQLLTGAHRSRILVVGDIMLDQFVWGHVARISPEAPVPVVDFVRESFMPGGAANVARNLRALKVQTELFGVVGQDPPAAQLKTLLQAQSIRCVNVLATPDRATSIKTRVVAHKQQIVRIDRETRDDLGPELSGRLARALTAAIPKAAAVIIGDYGKGVVTPRLLEEIKAQCRRNGVWLSLDPKPVHKLGLQGLSLVTPNRKETFELAGISDGSPKANPLEDVPLMQAAERLLKDLNPALLLITLGEHGMLLCERGVPPFHIPTIAQEVFDVSGAGDTVIASFTAAIAAGASPIEAAIISNHAAGIVVGKVGTATVTPDELVASFAARGQGEFP